MSATLSSTPDVPKADLYAVAQHVDLVARCGGGLVLYLDSNGQKVKLTIEIPEETPKRTFIERMRAFQRG